jgi:hypothetical protein
MEVRVLRQISTLRDVRVAQQCLRFLSQLFLSIIITPHDRKEKELGKRLI